MISSDGQVTINNDEKMEIVLNKFLESYSSMNKFIKYILFVYLYMQVLMIVFLQTKSEGR